MLCFRRTSCNRCNKEKEPNAGDSSSKKKIGTEIGKVIAEKSRLVFDSRCVRMLLNNIFRGLFSADDWSCVKCLNVNWARRSTCNLCNSAKFTENSEERTGNMVFLISLVCIQLQFFKYPLDCASTLISLFQILCPIFWSES